MGRGIYISSAFLPQDRRPLSCEFSQNCIGGIGNRLKIERIGFGGQHKIEPTS